MICTYAKETYFTFFFKNKKKNENVNKYIEYFYTIVISKINVWIKDGVKLKNKEYKR